MTRPRSAGVIAVVSGTLLIVGLLLEWWGLPDDLADPPPGAPTEIQFMAEAFANSGTIAVAADGFEFFAVRDVIWLVAGIAAFGFGLAAILGAPNVRRLAVAAGGLGLASLVSIAMALIAPPDFLEVSRERLDARGPALDYDLPVSRKLGGWVALAASLGVVAAALLAVRDPRSSRAQPS